MAPSGAPAGSLLYSLLHLGGFAGDLRFYSSRCSGSSRILELGCGDGRVAAAVVLGEGSLTILQQHQVALEQDGAATFPLEKLKCEMDALRYLGVEMSEALAEKARSRLAPAEHCAHIVTADFHEPLGEGDFDAAILSANTLFCTPKHELVLQRCAEALAPGGRLLLDVYNADDWHKAAQEEEAQEEALAADEADDKNDLLVVVEDESGAEWKVFEREPVVDAAAQTIACHYDFEATADGTRFSQTVQHHYVLPEQLIHLLDGAGFAIEAIDGGFDGQPFEPSESEHLVVVARKLGGEDDEDESEATEAAQ